MAVWEFITGPGRHRHNLMIVHSVPPRHLAYVGWNPCSVTPTSSWPAAANFATMLRLRPRHELGESSSTFASSDSSQVFPLLLG